MEEGVEIHIILGRLFLKTYKEKIYLETCDVMLRFKEDKVILKGM